MTMKILLKAQDPSSCAVFLGALGARLTPAKDDGCVWRGHVTLEVELAGGAGGFEARVATGNLRTMVQRLVGIGARADYSAAGDAKGVVRVAGPNGETVVLQELSEEPADERPMMDVAMFGHVSVWLDRDLDGLRAAIAEAGASNPRVLGPVALGGRPGGDFTLVLDGPPETDLAAVDAFIAAGRDGPVGLRARLAHTLPADVRERLASISVRR